MVYVCSDLGKLWFRACRLVSSFLCSILSVLCSVILKEAWSSYRTPELSLPRPTLRNVTPSEHLCLPTIDDVVEGIVASRIAAHAADITRGRGIELDYEMDRARRDLDWEKMFSLAIDPKKARRYYEKRKSADDKACSMCVDLCAIKMCEEYLEK